MKRTYLFNGKMATYFGPLAIYFAVPGKEVEIDDKHWDDPTLEAVKPYLTHVVTDDEKLAKIAEENRLARIKKEEDLKKKELEDARLKKVEADALAERAAKQKEQEAKLKEEVEKRQAEMNVEAEKKKLEPPFPVEPVKDVVKSKKKDVEASK